MVNVNATGCERICEVGSEGGIFLPIFGDDEQRNWPDWLRGILYFFGLGWTFLGVAVVSDIFMGAIEKITSQKRRVFNRETNKWYTVTVWNDTVANLTLMALGSSAPEILLNVIDLFKQNFYSGELGPSTIVGSAAFNLLMITAVCVSCIPDGQVRYIRDTGVFAVTATSSLFAYVWLFVIVSPVSGSEDAVEPWEGIVTFAFFPVLIIAAFAADKGWLCGVKTTPSKGGERVSIALEDCCTDVKEFAEMEMQCKRRISQQGATSQDMPSDMMLVEMMENECAGNRRVSRAAYRISATRQMVGGRRVSVAPPRRPSVVSDCAEEDERPSYHSNGDEVQEVSMPTACDGAVIEKVQKCFIEFLSDTYWVAENYGTLELTVRRYPEYHGNGVNCIAEVRSGFGSNRPSMISSDSKEKFPLPDMVPQEPLITTPVPPGTIPDVSMNAVGVVKVKYRTREGDAKGGEDFKHREGEIEFTEADQSKTVSIEILDDAKTEGVEAFYVDLYEPVCADGKVHPELGPMQTTQIKIIDDDYPGMLEFETTEIHVQEELDDQVVSIKVVRSQGVKSVSCKYVTEDGSAKAAIDYVPTQGELVFDHGQGAATIDVTIKPRGRYDNSDHFRLVLKDPTGGLQFNPAKDGGETQAICTIFIETDSEAKDRLDRLMKIMRSKLDKNQVGHSSWKDQFIDAIRVHGGNEDDEDEDSEPAAASCKDWVMHIVTLPWKVLFAFIPPVDYCNGWPCFFSSLAMIGLVTAFVGDMAEFLGCVLTMPDSITAVTLVALGTSLPDTFASKTAAIQDLFADASVGNVTGSNSVNVFLGIGLPWMIGSIFWRNQGRSQDESRYRDWERRYRLAPDATVVQDYPEGDVFVVLRGSLGPAVLVFLACALLCIGVLVLRRCHPKIRGELGGPTRAKYATSILLVFLWFVFIGCYVRIALNIENACD